MYSQKGDWQRALDNYMNVFSFDKHAMRDVNLLNNIGDAQFSKKEYQKGIDFYLKSRKLTEGQVNQLTQRVTALQGLAICARDLEDFEAAIAHCNEALNQPTRHKKFWTLNILGGIYNKMNSPLVALEMLDKAEKAYLNDTTATIHSPFFRAQINLFKGNALVIMKEFESALVLYQKALVENHTHFQDTVNYNTNPSLNGIYEPIYFLDAIHAKAKTQAALGDKTAALTTYQLTIQWIDSLQASYNSEASQLDWSSKFKPIYEEAIQVVYQLYQSTKNQQYLDLAFSFSEKSKNGILLETLTSNEGKSQGNLPDSLIQKERDLNVDIAFYEKVLREAKGQKDSKKEKLYQQYLSKTRLELVDLKEQIEHDYPKFHDWKYNSKATTIADVQSQLINNNSACLTYFVGDSTAFVFVITKTSATLIPLRAPAVIEHHVADFREALLAVDAFEQSAKTAFVNYQEKAVVLYQSVLETVIQSLPTDIQQLIIIPDGALNSVPFEALCKPEKVAANFDFGLLPYLLYDYQVHYAYSANLLLKNKNRRTFLPANNFCLAFAPPYEGTGQTTPQGGLDELRGDIGQLEGTANEIKQIANFINGEFDFSKTATERHFKTLADQYGILHLAMHGVADFDNANFNHLKFSNLTKDSLEDNLLHHYEIANMELQAQLVVLSACETGIGKYEKGEGVYSLARSFMYAGVPSVVMSLWKVNDASTSLLMPFFYEGLVDGQQKDEALQQAKLRFLKEANIEVRHPFYWAGFVVMGDAQGLKSGGMKPLYWFGFGTVLLIFVGGWFWRSRPS